MGKKYALKAGAVFLTVPPRLDKCAFYGEVLDIAKATHFSTVEDALTAIQKKAVNTGLGRWPMSLVSFEEIPSKQEVRQRTFGQPVTPGTLYTEYGFRDTISGELYAFRSGYQPKPINQSTVGYRTAFRTVGSACTALEMATVGGAYLELVALDTLVSKPEYVITEVV